MTMNMNISLLALAGIVGLSAPSLSIAQGGGSAKPGPRSAQFVMARPPFPALPRMLGEASTSDRSRLERTGI